MLTAATRPLRPFALKRRFAALLGVLFCILLLFPAMASGAQPRLLPAPNSADLWGYVDAKNGRTVIPARYTRAGMFQNGAAVVHMSFPQAAYSKWDENGKMHLVIPRGDGLIDTKGTHILTPVDGQFISPARVDFESPSSPPLAGLYLVQNFSGWGVFDLKKGWLLEAGPYEDISFMPDGSFSFNGGSYISAAPERNIYFAPNGYVIRKVELGLRAFILESILYPGVLGVATWSGEQLTKSSYYSITPYAACSRWGAMTMDSRLDIFDMKGKILQTYTPDFNPQVSDGGTITIVRSRETFIVDPCKLKLTSWRDYKAPEIKRQPEPDVGVVVVSWGDRAMLMDEEGNELISPVYDMILQGADGYWWGHKPNESDGESAAASADSGWVLIDERSGKEIRMLE